MTTAKQYPVTITGRRIFIAEQPMVGPESGGIQFCVKCHTSILRGEHWRKVWAADGSYAVGIHDACRCAQPDERTAWPC